MKIAMTLARATMFAVSLAHADGGAVCLREGLGVFLVTVFVAPQPIQVGPINAGVLVQDRQTGEVILDAKVDLAIRRVDGGGPEFLAHATHEQSTNKLLKSGRISLPTPGSWGLRVFVSHGRRGIGLRDHTSGLAGCTSSGCHLAVAALATFRNRPLRPTSDPLQPGRENAPITAVAASQYVAARKNWTFRRAGASPQQCCYSLSTLRSATMSEPEELSTGSARKHESGTLEHSGSGSERKTPFAEY